MTYFADLTPHTYTPTDGITVLNIGWLDGLSPYSRGTSSHDFHEALKQMCQRPIYLHRGFHNCELCPPDDPHVRPLAHPERRGSGQIRVKGPDEVWYAAPTLVHHYVTEHQYLPPAVFIESVLRHAAIAP